MENNRKGKKYKFTGIGLTAKEKHQAEKCFNEYKTNYHISNFSDLPILEELVFREVLQIRNKTLLAKYYKAKKLKDKILPPKEIITALDENIEIILTLKQKLGLFTEKKKGEDPYKYIQILKKKFEMWRESNQGSRTLICPHCSLMIMLKIRTEIWEAQKHPMFRDRIICNDHLVKIYMDKKIDKTDVAKVLGVSDDYVEWLIEKWYQNKKINNVN